MSKPITTYVPVGMLGYGYPMTSLDAAMAQHPSVVAVDAGSTDPGPYYLGTGTSFTSQMMVRRDLEGILTHIVTPRIPLVIGSAGGAGALPNLQWTVELLGDVARQHGLHLRVAVIGSDLGRDYVKQKLRNGEILTFESDRELTVEAIDSSTHIVAQMGPEPIAAALDEGADVVVAGRSLDAALSAALPIARGFDKGIAYHMGKTIECGSLIAFPRATDGVLAYLTADAFVVHPANPLHVCTVELVAAHSLYERSDPYHFSVPGGQVDTTNCRFDQVDERSVRVSGVQFQSDTRYLLKIEGSRRIGARSICIAGARDRRLLANLPAVLQSVRDKVEHDLRVTFGDEYRLIFRVYGRDGVMGDADPDRTSTPHEVGILIEAIAPDRTRADAICALARSAALHMGFPGRVANAGNLAFPFSPAEFPAPDAYEFSLYHLMEVAGPLEPFGTSWIQT